MLVKSYAKINIVLNVVGKTDNGYHSLDMVMLPLELHDSLLFSKIKDDRDSYVTFENLSIGGTENNLVSKAIRVIQKETKMPDSYRVLINKCIPISAGLGGGSSNCACALIAVNNMCNLGLTNQQLKDIGIKLGSDVPFFIDCVPARVQGQGEILHPIEVKNDYYCLLIKPKEGLSTAEVYKKCDEFELTTYNVDDVIKALKEGDDDLLAKSIGNSLEDVSIAMLPKVKEIKEELKAFGFKIAMMSGSGSSVFALSTDKQFTKKAWKHFFKQYNDYDVEFTKVRKGGK